MLLYIDPGTGSMLFTVLIGILGALFYLMRSAFFKIRFILSGGNTRDSAKKETYTFFTDSKRYYTIFKPLCDELESRGISARYLTASSDDPLLKENFKSIKTEFLGEGNRAIARMNMIKSDIVLSSTPGLDVYQWKRSRDVKKYVHILHAANDPTAYRCFGLDYYDVIMVSGEYQRGQIRQLEALRQLPAKELPMIGLPHMNSLLKRLEESGDAPSHPKTVLLAPTWGASGILSVYGGTIIEALLKTNYHIVIRPHPQSFVSEKEMIEALKREYPESDRLEWNSEIDNFDVLRRSDILISDYSGVIFDFSLVFDKPIIYADTSFNKDPYDAWWLDEEMWTFSILPKIGMQLTKENCMRIGSMMDMCLESTEYQNGREQARNETWANRGDSVRRAVDYLIDLKQRIDSEEDEGKRSSSAKQEKAS